MYTQQEASRARQEFWTVFGHYMFVVPNADGEKTNWVNYKTGNKNIQLKMDATNKMAWVNIEICHADKDLLGSLVNLFTAQKHLLETVSNVTWNYEPIHTNAQGKQVFIIYRELDGANIFDRTTWPDLISFFKQSIVGFDEFWLLAKYSFQL